MQFSHSLLLFFARLSLLPLHRTYCPSYKLCILKIYIYDYLIYKFLKLNKENLKAKKIVSLEYK
jgi:hypothetical protein